MGVETERFRLKDRSREIIGKIILTDWNREKIGADFDSHFFCFFLFVVIGAIESKREGTDRIWVVPRRESDDSA